MSNRKQPVRLVARMFRDSEPIDVATFRCVTDAFVVAELLARRAAETGIGPYRYGVRELGQPWHWFVGNL